MRDVGFALIFPVPLIVFAGLLVAWDAAIGGFGKLGAVAALLLALLFTLGGFLPLLGNISYVIPLVDFVQGELPLVAAFLAGLMILGLILLLYAQWVFYRAAFNLFLVKQPDRAILKDPRGGQTTWSRLLFRIGGLPPLLNFARRPRRRYFGILALSCLSAFFFGYASLASVGLAAYSMKPFAEFSLRCGWPSYSAECVYSAASGVGAQALIFFALVLLIPVCVFLGAGTQWLVQRLVRFSLERLQEVDPRAPVLFLRAFGDDQVPLAPAKIALYGRMLELGRRKTTLDHMLIEEATPYGPVVGLGNPADKNPPYGAARGYFNDRTWRQAVADLASNSVVVVLCLDDTDGVWWEVEHLLASRHLAKTLFLIHPKHALPDANERLLRRVAQILNFDPGRTERLLTYPPARRKGHEATVIAFLMRANGTLSVVHSSTFSRFAYLLTMRLFMREALGLAVRALPAYAKPDLHDERLRESSWYYAVGDKSIGPYSLADLTAILSRASNAKDVFVWQTGFEQWQRAGTVADLAAFVIKSPPS